MAELYSITGLFYESFPGILPWGGYFIRGINNIKDDIEGMLVDVHGLSRIEGSMHKDLLNFRKKYEVNFEQAFDYKFSLNDKGIWLGEWQSTSISYNGRSICKTNLILEELDFRKFDTRTPEGFAKILIDSMIDSGQLETFKDSETGEEMIRTK